MDIENSFPKDMPVGSEKFSCVLIGNEAMLICCSELLLKRGHAVRGLIAAGSSVSQWASSRGIPLLRPDEDLKAFLSAEPFDYLFSIANPRILYKDILELPRKYAINCHNSFLPKYAGVHATAWAILHEETTHGITWHAITEEIDGGDILRQVAIDIDRNETAFTLDGKCYEAAINSFGQVICDLEQPGVAFRKQNKNERSYFSASAKPTAGCVLSWNKPAGALNALVRSLDFGTHPNPLGLPKIALRNDYVIVTQLDVLDDLSTAVPGTIVDVGPNGIRVSSSTADVMLRQLHTLDGRHLPIRELVEQYGLRVSDRLAELDETTAARLQPLESRLVRHEAFWVKQLADLRPLVLPYPSGPASNGTGRERLLWHAPQTVEAFLLDPPQSSSTARDFLVATLVAFLSRVCQTDCFDLGFTHSGLVPFGDFHPLFAGSVPLRIQVPATHTIANLLDDVTARVAVTQRRLTYPRDIVLRYAELRSGEACSPELPVAIEYVSTLDNSGPDTPQELKLIIPEGALTWSWVYDAERFSADTISRMQAQYSMFLEHVIAGPAQAIATIPLLSERDRHIMQVAWNATQAQYPDDTCIHHMFEAQVERTPEAIALTFEDQALTYAALNCRANQLAHYLRELGVGPEVLVGLYVERSFEMIVGLLGILKAGGAYVPLDAASPPARLAIALEDAQARVVLTQDSLRETLRAYQGKVLCLDTDWPEIARRSQKNPRAIANAENLCYVIFTSGSAGSPKGVLVEHRGVCNLAAGLGRLFNVTSESRCLQFATLSFDTSVAEIVTALCAGARLCLAPSSSLLPGPDLLQFLRDKNITHAVLPPSTLAVLPIEPLPALRVLTAAGEACSADLVATWGAAPGRRFFNGYGPTETTVCGTVWECTGQPGKPPIGRPFANTQAYILDRHLQSVPVGILGELYLGGVNLARGYLNRPELTGSRFIPDPFSQDPQARLYKTGDLARYAADGNIEFVGRSDHQAKIRGYRIELEEIEAALKLYPGIEHAAVNVYEASPGYQSLVGYLAPREVERPAVAEVRRFLLERLPEYMVPERFVILECMPMTLSGKVDRRKLPAPVQQVPEYKAHKTSSNNDVERFLISLWSTMLGRESVSIHDNFFDQGGNSFLSLQTTERIGQEFGIKIPVVTLYQYPTIHALAKHLTANRKVAPARPPVAERATRSPEVKSTRHRDKDIAIIGMAGRFPGAANVTDLWHKLCAGEECITFFTDDELSPLIDPALRQDKSYVKAKGIISGADTFDAAFFGMTPREAEIMDPQHRLFLETAHEALENAGHTPEQFDGAIGVYGGSGFMSYFVNNLEKCPEVSGSVGGLVKVLSNDKDYMTTRVAYKLNLQGPCVSVGTACSTSLVAVVNAVTSLVNHQCDMAIAGGVTIDTPLNCGYLYEEEGMHSPDGHCRPFDAKAQGTVMGNGVAIVVLRRLADALRDGDHITAVIRGVGINNDGSGKVSFSAPGVGGQAAAIAMAHADAEIDPETISYVEGHGTATPLGDPIEVAALTQAFRARTMATGFCALGSIKGNLGHLDTAAGVTGLIKTALSLQHRKIPPSLHFEAPNPQIDFTNSPFYVNASLTEWKATAWPRRAGVSSFGMGGTNAHVVCEEAPDTGASGPSRPHQLLVLSARTPSALEAATAQLSQHLQQHPETKLADVCYTLARGRTASPHRRFVVCRETADAVSALTQLPPGKAASRHVPPRTSEIAFVFPGQGSQYLNMCRSLHEREEVFRKNLDLCAELLAPDLDCDLRDVLFASDSHAAETLNETTFTQPSIFSVSYSLSKLWESWGVHPGAMIGHSIGEFVAACLAGVFSLEDALRLIAKRGQLMGALPRGSMLSVRLGAAEMERRLGADVAIAAINGPSLCVVSGTTEAIARVRTELESDQVLCRPLQTSHAFHSAMVEPVVAPFTQYCAQVKLSPPRIEIVSTVTGDWLTSSQATDPAYWGRHLREPVRFAAGIQKLWQVPERVLLEVGPGNTGTILARQQIKDINRQVAISSLGTSASDNMESTTLCAAVGQLWLAGARIDWHRYYEAEQRHRLALPTYPFERKRFWIEPARDSMRHTPEPTSSRHSLVNGHAQASTGEIPLAHPDSDHLAAASGLIRALKEIVEQSTGLDMEPISGTTSFVEMGLDSLTLTQIAQRLQKQFNCKVTFRQLLEEYPNLNTLALALAREGQAESNLSPRGAVRAATPPDVIAAEHKFRASGNGSASLPVEPPRPFGAGSRIARHRGHELNPSQQVFVERLIEQYTRQTGGSKAYVQDHRLHLADPRTVSGFDPVVKEMVYPIVAARSAGARMWDVDGNEYIDVVSGFGSSLFGYLPPFIKEAIEAQLERGIEIGPQTKMAGEVAELLCELTHLDRATFCNTGSEAVLGAMRLARTVTGRSKIALFSGSYHGIFDEVLVRGTKQLRPIPAAPGVTQEAVDNILVVDYDSPEALRILEARIGELAAVLVEPVQSRRPELQPRTFLHLLRRLTERGGAALIVDEMITGFRIDQGGAQAHFGIRGDLATYGKIIGGGMPIGVLAGSAKFMDAIDGGYWQYGDASLPEVDITYFAGTFVRHPLAIAAAKAALEHLKTEGPGLQRRLNEKSNNFVAELNSYFSRFGAPMHLVNFGSLLKLEFHGSVPFGNLLYYVLRGKCIHIGEHRPFFFTTAHSDADFERIVVAFKEAVAELQRAGFLLSDEAISAGPEMDTTLPLEAPVPGARLGRDPQGEPGWYVPDAARPGKYVKVETAVAPSPAEHAANRAGA